MPKKKKCTYFVAVGFPRMKLPHYICWLLFHFKFYDVDVCASFFCQKNYQFFTLSLLCKRSSTYVERRDGIGKRKQRLLFIQWKWRFIFSRYHYNSKKTTSMKLTLMTMHCWASTWATVWFSYGICGNNFPISCVWNYLFWPNWKR